MTPLVKEIAVWIGGATVLALSILCALSLYLWWAGDELPIVYPFL